MPASNYVHIECSLVAKSDAAVLIEVDGERQWIPFSQLAEGEEAKIVKLLTAHPTREPVEDVTVSMTAWIAEKKGLEES